MSKTNIRRSLTTSPRRPAPRSTWSLGPARLWATIWFCNGADSACDERLRDDQPDPDRLRTETWRDPML